MSRGSGSVDGTNPHQLVVRAGLYRALERAFGDADLPWVACHHEDRGDGVLILVPPDVPKAPFVERLPHALVSAWRQHNTERPAEERIRLRIALHAGEANYDHHGVTGVAINLAFRLLDTGQLKASLADSPGLLALITSSWFFDEVVRHGRASIPAKPSRRSSRSCPACKVPAMRPANAQPDE